MRPIILLGLTLTLTLPLAGCGDTWWNPPLTGGFSPHAPKVDSDNMRRVMGLDAPTTALQTEPGNVWPGPLPPSPTLSDIANTSNQEPLPPPFAPHESAAPSRTTASQPAAPTVVPNGNGTSTVIHSDGRIETIPTAK